MESSGKPRGLKIKWYISTSGLRWWCTYYKVKHRSFSSPKKGNWARSKCW